MEAAPFKRILKGNYANMPFQWNIVLLPSI